jgi:hypothetical protein
VGPRSGLDVMAKRNIPSPRRESNPDHRPNRPARSVVFLPTELSRLFLGLDGKITLEWIFGKWVGSRGLD